MANEDGIIIEPINLDRKIEFRSGFVLPIKVRPVVIMQGFNGPWSHRAFKSAFPKENLGQVITDDSYSIDFDVPYGTDVNAAKCGIVQWTHTSNQCYEGDEFERGMKSSPSQIMIKHGDHSTLYAHLGDFERDFVIGELVEQGQPIAKTGKSGWVGKTPHLHFEVCTNGDYSKYRMSYRFEFEDFDGPLEHRIIFAE